MATQPETPTIVRIGPHIWELVFDQPATVARSRSNGYDQWGETVPEEQRIYVDPERPLSGQQQTLVHELLHAMILTYGADDVLDDDECRKREEKVVTILAAPLLDLLQDNPPVLAWLTWKG